MKLSPNTSRVLTGGEIVESANASVVITIALTSSDIRAIKLDEELATETGNTYLSIGADAFTDTDSNKIESVVTGASALIIDAARAELISFGINMETGQLNLTFNDIVIANTLDASGITIQNSRNALAANRVSLSSSSSTNSTNDYTIIVDIDPLDLLRVKSVSGLANSRNTTYITIQAFTIDDSTSRDMLAITNGKALRVDTFFADNIPPEIDFYQLDLNSGSLNITFTDTVDHTQLDVTFLTLHNDISSPSINLTVTGNAIRSSNGRRVDVILETSILNILKNDSSIGSSSTNTFLSIMSNAIPDLAGNYLNEVPLSSAIPVSSIILDTTGPEAVSFILDLNRGELTVNFTEIVECFFGDVKWFHTPV